MDAGRIDGHEWHHFLAGGTPSEVRGGGTTWGCDVGITDLGFAGIRESLS